MSKTQRESVEQAVLNVTGEYTSNLSKEQFARVCDAVHSDLASGEARLSDEARAKFDTTEKLMSYTRGMVNNWLRKSDTLNGGEKYAPSTKRGPRDEKLQALQALLKAKPEHADKINEAIEARKAEIEAERSKSKVVSINVDALPAELQDLAKAI